jgi:hypothetical protein
MIGAQDERSRMNADNNSTTRSAKRCQSSQAGGGVWLKAQGPNSDHRATVIQRGSVAAMLRFRDLFFIRFDGGKVSSKFSIATAFSEIGVQ